MTARRTIQPYDASTSEGQKRLMDELMGLPSNAYLPRAIDLTSPGDHGADPLGGGRFCMVPTATSSISLNAITAFPKSRRRVEHSALSPHPSGIGVLVRPSTYRDLFAPTPKHISSRQ